MTIQRVLNALLYGISTDTKPTNSATNTLFYEQDTGILYRWNGTAWIVLSGNTKTETLTNKTLSYLGPNTITIDQKAQQFQRGFDLGVWGGHFADTFPSYTAYGAHIVRITVSPAITVTTSVLSTEGICSNSATGTTINTRAGWYNGTANHFTCPDMNPTFKMRCRFNQTTGMRVNLGFSSISTAPTSDTLIATTGLGAFLGFRTTDTNMQLVTVNGTTATYTNTNQPIVTTGFHTWEVKMTAGSPVTVTAWYDGTQVASTTTTTPANGTFFSPLAIISNSSTTSVNWDLHYDIYRADF